MVEKEKLNQGFWFSYIDALTILTTVFIILLITGNIKAISVTKQREKFITAIDSIRPKLKMLGAKPKIVEDQGGWEITIAENILFNLNQVEIKESGEKYLTKICDILKYFENDSVLINIARITICGHADTTGKDAYNLFLSEYRANNVAYLIRQRLPKLYLETIGYGEKYPKYLNNAYNRRVTITIRPVDLELFSNYKVNQFRYVTNEEFKKIWKMQR